MGRTSTIATAGLLAALATAIPLSSKRQEDVANLKNATFETITPSTELKWVDCYGENMRCAYLTVPLDYEDPAAGTVNIAFQKWVHDEDAEDLLFNPGGPGASGVMFVEKDGPEFGRKWGYNMVSFDPRGIRFSGPTATCGPANDTAALGRRQIKMDDAAEEQLRQQYDTAVARNKACADANKDTDAKYIGTVAVVQDMMHFVELQAAAKGRNPKDAKINYYGISYGTVVGQTLAAVYPDRLNRVLLDANVHGVGFYQGWYPTSIDDLAHSFWMFAKLCFEAGPEWCGLAEGMKSIDEVKARFDKFLLGPELSPLMRESLVQILQQFLYAPVTHYRTIVDLFLSLENGTEWKRPEQDPAEQTGVNPLAQMLITAVDVAGRYPWKKYEDWRAATERLRKTAPYGPIALAMSNGLAGSGFEDLVPPPSQYFPGFEFVNTSAPVLFVNTAGDPVTPLSAAHVMSEYFGGSSWFIQNSPGHGIGPVPSKCTQDIVAAYFADGTLPKKGTWCEPDVEASFYFKDIEGTK